MDYPARQKKNVYLLPMQKDYISLMKGVHEKNEHPIMGYNFSGKKTRNKRNLM